MCETIFLWITDYDKYELVQKALTLIYPLVMFRGSLTFDQTFSTCMFNGLYITNEGFFILCFWCVTTDMLRITGQWSNMASHSLLLVVFPLLPGRVRLQLHAPLRFRDLIFIREPDQIQRSSRSRMDHI